VSAEVVVRWVEKSRRLARLTCGLLRLARISVKRRGAKLAPDESGSLLPCLIVVDLFDVNNWYLSYQ
jgi:hypothetical protein